MPEIFSLFNPVSLRIRKSAVTSHVHTASTSPLFNAKSNASMFLYALYPESVFPNVLPKNTKALFSGIALSIPPRVLTPDISFTPPFAVSALKAPAPANSSNMINTASTVSNLFFTVIPIPQIYSILTPMIFSLLVASTSLFPYNAGVASMPDPKFSLSSVSPVLASIRNRSPF